MTTSVYSRSANATSILECEWIDVELAPTPRLAPCPDLLAPCPELLLLLICFLLGVRVLICLVPCENYKLRKLFTRPSLKND